MTYRLVTKGLLFFSMAAFALFSLDAALTAHGGSSTITWNREISRLVYGRCASCHRPGGSAFSLMTYLEVQPRGNAIKDAVLTRRMPPWGAVKGFGRFRNDQSLTQEQIELITKWVDGGIRRGNNPQMLPKVPAFETSGPPPVPRNSLRVQGAFTLREDLEVDGVMPDHVPPGRSLRIVAVLPSGPVEPLVWLHEYDSRLPHPFLFRSPMRLRAGTVIQGVTSDAAILLLPASK